MSKIQLVPTKYVNLLTLSSFPSGSDDKESACNARDQGWIPGSGRSPGEENGYPLQFFCMEDPVDRGAWQATVNEVAKSQILMND